MPLGSGWEASQGVCPAPLAPALILVLVGVLGALAWPPWTAQARRRRVGLMLALTAGDEACGAGRAASSW